MKTSGFNPSRGPGRGLYRGRYGSAMSGRGKVGRKAAKVASIIFRFAAMSFFLRVPVLLSGLAPIALVAGVVASSSASAAEPMEMSSVVLLQPESVLQQRVPDVAALGIYAKAVVSAASTVLRASSNHPVTGGFLVLAVRPGQKSKVWLDFDPALPPELADAVVAKAQAVTPLSVNGGPVALALRVRLWGGPAPSDKMPAPAEWRAATQKLDRPIEIGELIERVWPQ